MNLARITGIALLLLMANGCSRSAAHYYTLMPVSDASPRHGAIAPFVVHVLPVTIPEQLSQPQLVIRKNDHEVMISDNALWAAPLQEEVRAALSSRLEHALNTTEVAGMPPAQDQPVVAIRVAVQQFDAWPEHHASLDATWRIHMAAQAQTLTCRTHYQRATTGGVPGLVETQQALMRDLAADIAVAVTTRRCR